METHETRETHGDSWGIMILRETIGDSGDSGRQLGTHETHYTDKD